MQRIKRKVVRVVRVRLLTLEWVDCLYYRGEKGENKGSGHKGASCNVYTFCTNKSSRASVHVLRYILLPSWFTKGPTLAEVLSEPLYADPSLL